jgi:hypothetical protein
MLTPKPIHRESIPRALAKAERYRLLNEPSQAESICRDILAVDPKNQEALVSLILAVTDLFGRAGSKDEDARALLPQLASEYDRLYYAGVVEERWARALRPDKHPRGDIRHRLHSAMQSFEEAQRLAPTGNDDAILRWNACVRLLQRYAGDDGPSEDRDPKRFDDEVPMR